MGGIIITPVVIMTIPSVVYLPRILMKLHVDLTLVLTMIITSRGVQKTIITLGVTEIVKLLSFHLKSITPTECFSPCMPPTEILTWVLASNHMKDHSSGCTFGGCASYAMAMQANWYSNLFGAGLGLYTSNEWPYLSYDDFRDTGSCTDLKTMIDIFGNNFSNTHKEIFYTLMTTF